MRRLGYTVIDADNHYYEPHDAFTRHIDPNFRDRAVRIVPQDGMSRVYLGPSPARFMRVTQSDYIGPPGALAEFFEGKDGGDLSKMPLIDPHDYPPFMNRKARLELMDEQGIAACILLPTLAVTVEHELHDDPAACMANLVALNRWIEEDWGFGADGRLFGVPMLSLLDLDLAVAELERLIERGARIVHLKPSPLFGRSMADPEFDPFWARCTEARIVVAFHAGDSGYNEMIAAQWGPPARVPLQRMSALQWFLGGTDRPIADTLANLILYNLFGRFPELRVASIENGSLWVDYTLRHMDKCARLGRNGTWPGGPLSDTPSAIFRRHVYVSPFFEDDIVGLVKLIGAERVLFGSDYPHPEGLAEPLSMVERLDGLSESEVRLIMRDNAAGLLELA